MLFAEAWTNIAALELSTLKLKASMHPPESLEQLAEEFHTNFYINEESKLSVRGTPLLA